MSISHSASPATQYRCASTGRVCHLIYRYEMYLVGETDDRSARYFREQLRVLRSDLRRREMVIEGGRS